MVKKGNDFNSDPYLKITNLLLGAIVNSKDLLTYEGKVFMLILFKTVGFQKEKDWLTWRQIKNYTGINHKPNIYRAIKKLKDKNMIIKNGKYFKVNQNFEKWLSLDNENIELIKESYQYKKVSNMIPIDNKDNKKVSNMIPEGIKSDTQKVSNMIPPSTDNIITDKINTDYDPIIIIFNYWNEKEIIIHKKLDKATSSSINARLKDNSIDEIRDSINYYSIILKDDDYRWDYAWTLKEFMQKGFEKFKDWDIAYKNYYIRKEKYNGYHA
ncbi:hypothetical protein ES708_19552 [subsurface metagenome]